ncbi:MAG: hypothetical protein IT550_11745 [Novosphingobium sp.]|nr:hypothetical protein [Novosphingobium sp.]
MAAFLTEWTVRSHGDLVQLDTGLLAVEGVIPMPLGNFPRRMTVIGLAGGGLAIWSAIALREPEMRRLEALGQPEWLIVPGAAHRLDAHIWKQRYPHLRVLCAPGAAQAVAEAVPVDATGDPFRDSALRFVTVPGTGAREAALLVRHGPRVTLIVNDIIANVRHPRGLGTRIMTRLLGFGIDGPRVPRFARRFFLDDPVAMAGALRGWAGEPGLARIVPAHGDVIETDPHAALLRIACDLDGRRAAGEPSGDPLV